MPDALMRAIRASGSSKLETLVASLLVTQPVEQDSDVVHGRAGGVADDRQRLLRAVGVVCTR